MKRHQELKQEILAKIVEYYQQVHRPIQDEAFVPGVSRVNYAGRVYDDRELVNLVDSALDFWLTWGPYSRDFEQRLAAFLGIKSALLVNSGSSANLLAFFALTSPLLGERRVRRGDEVITVAAGFPTTVAPIVQYGAVPVFVDIELRHFNIDVHQLKQALSPKSKAVMIAHTLGNPFNLHAVTEFCRDHRLWLIEDNCDALGSLYAGKPTGTWGDMGTSSFYPPHHLTMGEGGAVYTDNPLLKKILLSMRDWGRDCWCDSGKDNTCSKRFSHQFGTLPDGYDHKYVYSHFGFNFKATDLQAAIGCAQLEKLPSFISRRRANYASLHTALKDMEGISFMEAQPDSEPSWFGFPLLLNERCPVKRNHLAERLEKAGIQTRNLFAGNLLRHPLFAELQEGIDYRVVGELQNTDRIMNDCLWVGVFPGMRPEAIEYMISTLKTLLSTGDSSWRK